MKHTPLLLYLLAGTFLSGLLAFSYYKIVLDVQIDKSQADNIDLRKTDTNATANINNWIFKLKDAAQKNYAYPVSEIEISLQEEKPGLDEKFYKVVIDGLDGYKFFCVNQVLSANNINYSFYKEEGLVKLVIASPNYKSLKGVMDTIREYGIDYKIEE